jgi:hypothetical protein
MAFAMSGLTAIGQSKRGNAPGLFLYKTADTQATVNTAGYFNSIAALLTVGDVIFVYDSTTPSLVITYVNAVSAAGVVDIADGTTVSATDTD